MFDFERPFHSLPSGWVCKVCGAPKDEFESLDGDDGEEVRTPGVCDNHQGGSYLL